MLLSRNAHLDYDPGFFILSECRRCTQNSADYEIDSDLQGVTSRDAANMPWLTGVSTMGTKFSWDARRLTRAQMHVDGSEA